MKKFLLTILILVFYLASNAQSPLRINRYLVDSLASGFWKLYHDSTHTGQWGLVSGSGGGGSGTIGGTIAANQVAYGSGADAIQGNANLTYNGSLQTNLSAGLGVTQDDTKGLVLINTTAAAAGAQQISPAIRWSAQGWKTDATAASREVEFRAFVLPVEGTTNPSAVWQLQNSINAGAYFNLFRITSNANMMLGSSASVSASAGFGIAIGTGTVSDNYGIAMNGSASRDVNAVVFSVNAIDSSSNTFMGGGQNTVIRDGANGSVSFATDGVIYGGSAYSLIANDANEVIAESATVIGFGNKSSVRNSFLAGNTNNLGSISGSIGTLNNYDDSWAIGTNIITTGSRNGSLGYRIKNTGQEAIILGMGFGTGSSSLTNAVRRRFGVGMNSDSLTLIVDEAAGTTGTYGVTSIRGTLNLGLAGSSSGVLTTSGSTSGTITIQPAAAAGTYTLTLPTNDGDASQFLQTDGSGVLTWASAAGGAPAWNDITSPTGAQALTFQGGENSVWTDQNTTADNLTINSSTGTTNSLISLNRTGTALAAGNNIMELVSSGANGTAGITATGLNISVTNTGSTSVNAALTLTASGATTNNAITVTAGRTRLPTGSSAAASQSLYMNELGLFSVSDVGLGLYFGAASGYQVFLGQTGLIFGQNTAVIDLGQSGTFATTNRIRLSSPAEGTVKFHSLGLTAATVINGTGGENTSASLALVADEGDDAADTWTVASTTGNLLTFTNTAEVLSLSTNGGLWSVRVSEKQGADVASVAGAIALGVDGSAFEITGTNAITLISNVNFQNGAVVTLAFTSTATLTDGTANSGTDIGMELAGNTNFVASAGATLTLRLLEIGGTQRWREIARSVN